MSLTKALLKYMDFTKEYGKPSDETIDYFLQSPLAKQLLVESPKYLVSSESVKESADSLWSSILENYDSDDSITLKPKYNGGFDFYKYLSEQEITEENFREIIEAYEINPNNTLNDESEETMNLYLENSPDLIKIDEDGKEYIECHTKNHQAKAKVYRDSVVLLKDSIRNDEDGLSYNGKTFDEYFENNRLKQDVKTNSPSQAVNMIMRYKSNGYEYLYDDYMNKLQYYREKIDIKEQTASKIEKKTQSSDKQAEAAAKLYKLIQSENINKETDDIHSIEKNVQSSDNQDNSCIKILVPTTLKPLYKFDDKILEEDEHGRFVSTHLQYKQKRINCHIKIYEDGMCLVPAGEIIDGAEDSYIIDTRKKYDIPLTRWTTTKDIWCNSLHHLINHTISNRCNRGYNNVSIDKGGTMQSYYVKRTEDNQGSTAPSTNISPQTSKEQGELMDNSIETSWDSNERKAKTIISDDLIEKQAKTNADAIIDKLKDIKSEKSNGLEIRPLRQVNLNTEKEIKWPDEYKDADTIIKILKIKHFLMLTGVPGTGKSTASKELARKMLNADKSDQVLLLSFNSATEYNDIVGGIKLMDNDDWSIKTGELTNICYLAKENPDKDYIVLIDEINRGDTTGVLGEYMTALADIGSEVTTNFGIPICIPKNLYIIATMNTYDSSIIELDDALKNRFAQIKMDAKEFTAEDIKPNASEELYIGIDLVIKAIKEINQELSKEAFKGENNTIGFRNLYTDYEDIEGLILVVKTCIIPNIRDHYSNLDEDIKKDIDKIIKKLLKDISEIEE